LIGADAIEKLSGRYKMSDLIKFGNELYGQERFGRAFDFFKIICREVAKPEYMVTLSQLFFSLDRWREALAFFMVEQENHPKITEIREILAQIHNYFFCQGESYRVNHKPAHAADSYELALKAYRHPTTLKNAAKVYKDLNQIKKSYQLETEFHIAKQQQKEHASENKRLSLITSGKKALKEKDFTTAIRYLDEAFRIKPEKNVFMYLSFIYKTLNQKKALNDLIHRYKKEIARVGKTETN
jgi:tetratricopeptide (TPR) repeat protein